MKIAIVGSGNIGSTAARLFLAAGHQVSIANSRGPGSLRSLQSECGESLHAATVPDAVSFCDVVLVAIPFGVIDELPAVYFTGKIVIDATNYYPGRDGQVADLDNNSTTSSEILARRLPGATVIKAFNTMYFATLAEAGDPTKPSDERLALFVAGDDHDAKQKVIELIDQLGFAAVDSGSLHEGGRRQQPGTPIYNVQLTAPQAARALSQSR